MSANQSRYMLWIEGVDFDETLYDTSDLSTIRGASLALLESPRRLRQLLEAAPDIDQVAEIFSGASQAAFQLSFSGDVTSPSGVIAKVMGRIAEEGQNPEDLRKAGNRAREKKGLRPDIAPFAHLRFVWGLAPCDETGSGGRAMASAQAKARFQQLQSGGVRRPPPDINEVCRIDRRRPADAEIWVKADIVSDAGQISTADAGAYSDAEVEAGVANKTIPVSASVAARRHYGRWARQGFYAVEAGLTADEAWGLGFADSLHDIVADPPPGTPLPLRQKLAVFYADGNKFGKIRGKLSKDKGAIEAFRLFSTELKSLQREKLLRPLIDELRQSSSWAGGADWQRAVLTNKDRAKMPGYLLRFETLLWGGDELTFVVPAWLGWWLARRFFELTAGWQIERHKLTFAAGLVFTSYKTPIRDAKKLAVDLADIAKDAYPDGDTSALEVEALESVDPPLDGISGLRARLAGVSRDAGNEHALTLRADEIEPFCERLASFKRSETDQTHVPRSQVYRILQQMSANRGRPADRGEIARQEWEEYRQRTGRGPAPDDLALTERLQEPEHFGLNFYQFAEHWDYVDPYADEALPRPAEKAA